MGEIAFDKGNQEEAEELFHRALATAEEVEDRLTRAEILHNLAVLNLDRGELTSAGELLAEAESVLRDIRSRERLIDVHLRQATLTSKEDMNHGEIDERLRKAWALVEELDSKSGRAGFHLALGKIQRGRKNLTEALANLQKALQLFEELKWRKMIGEVLFECGVTLRQAEKGDEAVARFREARDVFEELSLGNRVEEIDQHIHGSPGRGGKSR